MTHTPSLPIERNSQPMPAGQRDTLLLSPGWGQIFTDHMATIRFTKARGWHDAKIEKLRPLPVHPAMSVLHYAQEIFEGLKAYRQPDGGVTLFRPEANAKRFRESAARLAMAELPEELFLASVRDLVHIDRDWVPSSEGASLYLRPFMVGADDALGANPASDYLYVAIASPVASYFKGGVVSGVTLWVSENYTRAAPGGTGAAKCGGNYAASLAAQAEGRREGCEQVVFLDAVERRWIEELGGMNIFFVFDDGSLQTPPLTGTILPGITRSSLITLAADWGLTVRETPYAIDQWQDDAKSGRLREAFACGTAAVITPIGAVKGREYDFTIGDGGCGELTGRLKKSLTDIQFGRAPDPHGWLDRVI